MASVTSSGLITGNTVGSVFIWTTHDGLTSDSTVVNVVANSTDLSMISISSSMSSLIVGDSVQLTGIGTATDGLYRIATIPSTTQISVALTATSPRPQIDQYAINVGPSAEIASEVSEQYAQSITPPPSEDPLVSIRKQELALKGQELAQRQEQFEVKQQFAQDKERNDVLLDQQRLDQQEEIANQNDQTKRDIAAAKEMKG